jgi:thioredoxin reductase
VQEIRVAGTGRYKTQIPGLFQAHDVVSKLIASGVNMDGVIRQYFP